jgi:hypothetical protein
VTRRPKSRLPPKLPDTPRARVPARPKEPSQREQLKDAHVAGRSARFSSADVARVVRALARDDPTCSLGVPAFGALTPARIRAAIEAVYGWDGEGAHGRIDPTKTLAAFEGACARIVEVARGHGRIAFATARPASLQGVYRALAATATAAGGTVLEAAPSSPVDDRGRRLWWLDGVATVTDGERLLVCDTAAAVDELLFVLPQPDLVVADGWFAGGALAAGLEVVACADLDAVALAVASWRGMAIRVVPLDTSRPPHAYRPLLATLSTSTHADPSAGLAGRSGTVGPRSGT